MWAMADEAIQPVYVLHGADAFLRDAHRREIVAHAVGNADPQLCVSTFDAEAELAVVLDELRTMPFLAERRVVVVRDADRFVSAHRRALEGYLESPCTTGTLVLMVSSWPSNTRLAKRVAKIGRAIDCSPPEGGRLVSWLTDAASRHGKKLQRDAAVLLSQWIGGDLSALDGELEKLATYVGEREAITAEDVSRLVTATAGPQAFDLTDAIRDGKPRAALEALSGLLNVRGEEFRVLGLIAWHLRLVLGAHQAVLAGKNPDGALGRIPYRSKQGYRRLLQRRPLGRIQQDFRELIRVDLAMKSGATARAAMQDLVLALCN